MFTSNTIPASKANIDLKQMEIAALSDDQLEGVNGGAATGGITVNLPAPLNPGRFQPGPSCPGYR
jgi:hypothetical protein